VKVGVVAHNGAARAVLRRALEELGHIVLLDTAPEPTVTRAGDDRFDLLIWVGTRAGVDHHLSRDCFQLELPPAFMAAADADYTAWKQNLRRRIEHAPRVVVDSGRPVARAERVWLLAASTGGPDAVERFLAATIPAPGVALLYVQHLTAAHFPQLVRRLATRADRWHVQVANTGNYLLEGTLSIVSPDHKLRIHRERGVRVLPSPWPGPYRPSADQVAESLALAYHESAGMMVFSGMGDDGALGSDHIREHGGEVWVQRPDQCVASAMPEAVLARGEVDYSGDVAALARRFNYRYGTPAPGPQAEVS
jgi:chemotaxis response regulator CheB